MTKGFFITVEGVEGAGKSTMVHYIQHVLAERNYRLVKTREPGGSPLAEDIRRVLLSTQHQEAWAPATELLLMYAARAQHLNTLIVPNLLSGVNVICDRFCDASYAYQVVARGASRELFYELERYITQPYFPDLTILLDLDPEIGMARVHARGQQLDRIEQEQLTFFKQVRLGYLQRAEQFPKRIVVVNADQPQEAVIQAMENILTDFLLAYTQNRP